MTDYCAGNYGNNRAALYNQCRVSLPINVSVAGQYTITATVAGIREGLQTSQTNQISAAIEVTTDADPLTAQTSGALAIKQKLVDLHSLMLGQAYTVDSAEIQTAYQLFVDSWQERKALGEPRNLINDSESCEWFRDHEFLAGLGIDEERPYSQIYPLADDAKFTKQAWVTVITYLMTHYHYLYE